MKYRFVLLIVLTAVVAPALVGLLSSNESALYAADAPDAKNLQPGLTLTIESGGAKDSVASRLVALRVVAGANPTPFLPAGAFKATWQGFIKMRLRDEMTFAAQGRGKVQMELNGEAVLDASGDDLSKTASKEIRLKKGLNELKVTYTSPDSGDAFIRLGTVRKDGSFDPISPNLYQHDVTDAMLKEHAAIREGRQLLADLRCLNCHTADAKLTSSATAIPELKQDAPLLTDAGDRLNPAWLVQWINNPKSLRKDAHMPRVFHDAGPEGIDPRAKDVAAYLASLHASPAPNDEPIPGDESLMIAGAQLYANLGCVGCHTTPDQATVAPEDTRVPLRFIKAKYKPSALVAFLKKPESHYAWIRMPNFHLTDDEATQLAAYLLHAAPADALPKVATDGDPAKGKALVESAGCLNCHATTGKSTFTGPELAKISVEPTKGCLADADAARGKAPEFNLTPEQRASIANTLKSAVDSIAHDTRAEFAERQVHALNCVACHVRDGVPDVWASLGEEVNKITSALPKVDEGVVGDQSRPDLTWVGEKLRPQWMGSFISGEITYNPRPWLKARMPWFPARGHMIAEGFALQHAFSPATQPVEQADASEVELGRKLVGRQGGFSCIQCHGVGEMKPFGAFEAQAINYMYTAERMTHDFYHRWVRDPQRYQPGTRMPQYADNAGKTPYKDILGGDAHAQFEAIWQYLLQGRKMNPPE
jgi:mono/diheme cytochrome c family protein